MDSWNVWLNVTFSFATCTLAAKTYGFKWVCLRVTGDKERASVLFCLQPVGLAVSDTARDHKSNFAVCFLASRDPGGKGNCVYWDNHWNEHIHCALKDRHGSDIFTAGQNFPSMSGARGQQGRGPVGTLITYGIPPRACWVLGTVVTSDLVGRSITQQTTVGAGSVLEHSWGPLHVPPYIIPTPAPSCSPDSHPSLMTTVKHVSGSRNV